MLASYDTILTLSLRESRVHTLRENFVKKRVKSTGSKLQENPCDWKMYFSYLNKSLRLLAREKYEILGLGSRIFHVLKKKRHT